MLLHVLHKAVWSSVLWYIKFTIVWASAGLLITSQHPPCMSFGTHKWGSLIVAGTSDPHTPGRWNATSSTNLRKLSTCLHCAWESNPKHLTCEVNVLTSAIWSWVFFVFIYKNSTAMLTRRVSITGPHITTWSIVPFTKQKSKL